MAIFGSVLMLLAGLGVFLLGMQLISGNLQKVAGRNVKKMLSKLSGSRLAGIGVGAGAGMLLESSSATTVILLGFVNAGLVNLIQATLIIMGANVGTTVSVLLISMSAMPVSEFLAFLALVGVAIVMGAKKTKTKNIGYIIAGIGTIFVGLNTMSSSVEFLKESATFVNMVSSLKNPFLLVLLGTFVSGIIQSSTAITGIVITLSTAGIMPVSGAFFIILGSNIGTCMSAILASLSSNLNAKRTALIHFMFNFIGVIVFMPFIILFGERVVASLLLKFSPAVIIAYFHVFFNLITTIILFPFVRPLAELSVTIIPDKMCITEKKEKIKKLT